MQGEQHDNCGVYIVQLAVLGSSLNKFYKETLANEGFFIQTNLDNVLGAVTFSTFICPLEK